MSESAAIVLMMNNYLHDVATALLVASGYVMWVTWKCLDPEAGHDAMRYFVRMYYKITKLARLRSPDQRSRFVRRSNAVAVGISPLNVRRSAVSQSRRAGAEFNQSAWDP